MKTYLVGGAVRDKLLGLPPGEKDWVVVGAKPQHLLDRGYTQVGKDFPVFLHPETKEEYALARLERKTAPGHKGFEFDTTGSGFHRADDSPVCQSGFEFDTTGSVTLEDDLKRRDLTVNAIAEAEDGTLIDPYGGQKDLAERRLRHVSEAFAEDPLRVLRVARFAARFAELGFTVADETLALMGRMSAGDELASLSGERVWREIALALNTDRPDVFISVLRDCGALKALLPEVDALFGVPQPERHHPEVDTGLHILLCLQQAARLGADPVVRYAVLMHDLGKALTDPAHWPSHHRHETLGLRALSKVHERIPVPKEYAEMACLVCEHHTNLHRALQLRPATLLSLLEKLDAFRRPQRLARFILAGEADSRGRTGLESEPYPQGAYLQSIFDAADSIDAGAVVQAGQAAGREPRQAVRQARLKRITQAVKAARG